MPPGEWGLRSGEGDLHLGGSASSGWGSASRGKGLHLEGAGLHPGEGVCIQGVGHLLPHSLGTRKAGSTRPTGMLSCYQKCN